MTIKLLAFSGSSRRGSFNGRLRDLALPLYDGDLEAASGLPAGALAFKQAIAAHDALLIASPEYNGLFTPLLKNAIDWASRPLEGQAMPFTGRVAGLLAASPGALGGMRGLPVVRQLLNNLGVLVTPGQMALPRASEAFDGEGKLRDAAHGRMLERVVKELLNTTRALQPTTA